MGKLIQSTSVPQPPLTSATAPAVKSWRMVFDNTKKVVLSLFEATGEFKTTNGLFVSDPTDGSTGSVTSQEGMIQCLNYAIQNNLVVQVLPMNMRFSQPPRPVTHAVPNKPALVAPSK